MLQDQISASAIREELNLILKSGAFARSERMRRFLTYIVVETLAGRGPQLKEYPLALNVYDKAPTFDPRLDSLIRVEGHRLRQKLQVYYNREGHSDPVRIVLPKDKYVPQFQSAAARNAIEDRPPARDSFADTPFSYPGFASASAGVADCYVSLAWLECMAPKTAWDKAVTFARRALRQQANLADALSVLGCEKVLHQWDWAGAEEDFQQAIHADASCAKAHRWYAVLCLVPQRRWEESLFHLKVANELEPDSALSRCHRGRVLHFQRRYSEAVGEFQYSIRLDPKLFIAPLYMGMTYAAMGRLQEARAAIFAAHRLTDEVMVLSSMAFVEAAAGHRSIAESLRNQLIEQMSTRYVSGVSMTLAEIALGNLDGAFRNLTRAIEERATRLVHISVDPAFDAIKTDPRFLGLLSSLRL
jgi:tetratricopeptide (TPR) repeat protein